MTEAAEYTFYKEQYTDVDQPEPIEEKLGRAVDKFKAAVAEIKKHVDILAVTHDHNGQTRVHCYNKSFFELFTPDEVDYAPRESESFPHEYFVTINGIEFFCISMSEVNG